MHDYCKMSRACALYNFYQFAVCLNIIWQLRSSFLFLRLRIVGTGGPVQATLVTLGAVRARNRVDEYFL